MRCSSASRRIDAPRYAIAVVVEHGDVGAASAAPIARAIDDLAIQSDPAGRDTRYLNPAAASPTRTLPVEWRMMLNPSCRCAGRSANARSSLAASCGHQLAYSCCLRLPAAGVGYASLYCAAGGAPEPYAHGQMLRFAGVLAAMICIAMVDIRVLARLAWPSYALGILLLLVVMKSAIPGSAPNAGSRWGASKSSRAN